MFKVQIKGGESAIKFLGRNADVFADSDLAHAVVEKLGRLAKRFSVSKTEDSRFAVVGEQSFFGPSTSGETAETVVELPMRSELEPSVFDDAEVAQLHADRLNDHYAGPVFEIVEVAQ